MVTPPAHGELRLLDSCICIDWMRRGDDSTGSIAAEGIALSAIVVAELLVAAHKHHHVGKRLAQVERLTRLLPVLPFDSRAAEHYGDIRAALEKKGDPIGPMNLLIAAHARSLGAKLVTLNAREFQKVPGLRWIAP